MAAFFKSLEAVLIEYLDDIGATWFQLYTFNTTVAFACLITYWFVTYTILFLYNNKNTTGSNISDDNSDNNQTTLTIANYKLYIFSLFPSKMKNDTIIWKWLCVRSVMGATSWIFYVVALVFLEPGDFILLQTVTITASGIIIGLIHFKEKITISLLISTILLIIGVLLVCQPSIIFGENAQSISILGIIFAILAGIARVLSGVAIKKLNQFNLHWLAISLPAQFLAALYSLIMFVIMIIFYQLNFVDENEFWWNWTNKSDYSNDEISIYTLLLMSLGFCAFGWVISFTLAYLFGDVSWLSILMNSDVIMTYLMQIWILNQSDNWLVYVGVTLVMIACLFLLGQQYCNQQRDSSQPDDNSSQISDQPQDFQTPFDVETTSLINQNGS